MVVEPVHVDHSIPAAYGFLIHMSEGAIVYTGDLRAHGPRKDMTEEFADKACESELVAMVCEGARMVEVERRKNYSEQQVERLSGKVVSSTDKIVFFTRYSRDMDRFRSFYNVAENNGRKIFISPKTVHLLSRLVEDKHLDLPDPLKNKNILVYYKRKKSGGFDEKDYYVWERDFMDKMVTFEFVHENQGKLVMDLDFYQFAELIDIKPSLGSHFIHSMSEPFSEEAIKSGIFKNDLASYLNVKEYSLYATTNLPRSYLLNIKKRSEKVLDEMEELKKAMQELERQFLPEDMRDGFSFFEIEKTKCLHEIIRVCIDEMLDYLRKHPDEGLLENGKLVPEVDFAVRNVDNEIAVLEETLARKYPDYDYHYGDYYPGTLMSNWKHFLKLFMELFSKDNF